MTLPALVPTLDGLHQEIAKEYVPGTGANEGKFVLDVSAVEGVDLQLVAVGGLKSALSSEREALKQAKAELKNSGKSLTIGDDIFDIDKVSSLIQELEVLKNSGGDPEGKLSALQDALKKQYEEKEAQIISKHSGINSANEELISKLRGTINTTTLENEASKVISDLKGNSMLLMPHIEKAVKGRELEDGRIIFEVINKDGSVRISPKADSQENMSVAEYVQEMRDSKTFAAAFEGSGASGSGSETNKSGPSTNSEEFNNLPSTKKLEAAFAESKQT